MTTRDHGKVKVSSVSCYLLSLKSLPVVIGFMPKISEEPGYEAEGRRSLFPFRKRSLPLLKVDAIIGNQAFSHGRSNICSGLMYNKATNTFLNSLRKNKD